MNEKGSNSSERVEWVLRWKSIPFQSTIYHEKSHEDYRKINPFLRVPSLKVEGKFLNASMEKIEFLEK